MQPVPETPSSVLVIRLSSLGDVVLATPIVRAVRTRFPDARIDVAVAREYAGVWHGNRNVTTVRELDNRRSAAHGLRRDALPGSLPRYDVVIDLQNNLRSSVLRLRLGARRYVVSSMRKEKRALVGHSSQARALPHVVERYFRAVAPLGVQDDGKGLELWASDGSGVTTAGSDTHRHVSGPSVILAPGAKHATKRWPAASFAGCAEALLREGFRVTVIGTDQDAAVCSDVMRGVDATLRDRLRHLCVRTLEETKRIMNEVDGVVANDSSIVHIASAMQVPVVDIYGSTVPALGFTPYRCAHVVVEADTECRPCTHIG
ncbi:MAG: glycosyltransferase family 9 protein, partial [Candidatus Kapaibacterium sp.]